MAYEKQTWQSGDVITAAKMNHIEDGIANCGVFIINATQIGDSYQYQLDKTYNQIYSAIMQGKICYIQQNMDDDSYLSTIAGLATGINYYMVLGRLQYKSDSADGTLIGVIVK